MLNQLLISFLLSIFAPPVDYDISLAGNFGEPRPNHFHGGLDISTDNVEGKVIYAIGDGYVSRITQGIDGFGNAVYVTPPEGYTSIYCHLKSFSPRIQAALRDYQYAHETNVPDARLSPLVCPVSQGQFIACRLLWTEKQRSRPPAAIARTLPESPSDLTVSAQYSWSPSGTVSRISVIKSHCSKVSRQ